MKTVIMGEKVLHEFYCTNCSGYISAKLRMDLNGAHCIKCPKCGHEHYRIITNGEITDDRAPSKHKAMDTIEFPKASYSKTSWERKLHLRDGKPEEKNFLNQAWQKIVGGQLMGQFTFLCESGDDSFCWDKDDPEQVEEAKAKFKKWTGKGYKIFKVEKKKQIPMKVFDPNAEEILVIQTTKKG